MKLYLKINYHFDRWINNNEVRLNVKWRRYSFTKQTNDKNLSGLTPVGYAWRLETCLWLTLRTVLRIHFISWCRFIFKQHFFISKFKTKLFWSKCRPHEARFLPQELSHETWAFINDYNISLTMWNLKRFIMMTSI